MRRDFAFVVLLSVLFLGPAVLRAAGPQPPSLVLDLNRTPLESDGLPESGLAGVEMGGSLYFPAMDPAHGLELWRSDGTTAGTRRVSDLRPGPTGSDPHNLTAFKGRLYFTADDGVRGIELWSTDGSPQGTRLLADLCPGPCSAVPFHFSTLIPSGDRLFFTGLNSRGDGVGLWATDGTREGTVELSVPGSYFILQAPLTGGRALFTLLEGLGLGSPRIVLVSSDGTPGGTVRLPAGDSLQGIGGYTPLGGAVLFWRGGDLWRTDGTNPGTQLVREGVPRSTPVLVLNGIAYFSSGAAIWETDGTAAGTVQIGEGYPQPVLAASSCGPVFQSSERIWRIREPQQTIEPLSGSLRSSVGPWSAGGRVFYATDGFESKGSDLWTVDPDTCQARRVTGLCGADRPCPDHRLPLGTAGAGQIGLFGLDTASEGLELWRSDGSEAGTFRVRDIGFDPGSGAGPIARLGNQAVFAARRGAGPAGLWRTNGTVAGTRPVKFVPWPQDFANGGGFLYFTSGARQPCEGRHAPCRGLWRTNGTPAGTVQISATPFLVKKIATGAGRLLFAAADNPQHPFEGTGVEPWLSDGTAAGTRMAGDLSQEIDNSLDVGSSYPGPGEWTGSRFLFSADDGIHGRELWSLPGSGGPPVLLDLNTVGVSQELFGSEPASFTRLGNAVLFSADDGVNGRELWISDGTAAGTRLVLDIRAGAAGSAPRGLAGFNGKVWFVAGDGGGQALWSTDGTAAGTVRVAGLGNASWGRDLVAVGSRLFFVVDDDATGSELWTSDGTAAGTRLVRDIRPGSGGSYPQSLTAVDGLLVFAADDGTTGLEPWVSDGTAAGTRQLGDLAPGLDASSPGPFVAAGSRVIFPAWNTIQGRELWAVPRAGLR